MKWEIVASPTKGQSNECQSSQPAAIASGAKALVALWEALPSHAFHHGAFEFRDDGEASRSLFDAVAGMTGLTPLVRELEARLAGDVACPA